MTVDDFEVIPELEKAGRVVRTVVFLRMYRAVKRRIVGLFVGVGK